MNSKLPAHELGTTKPLGSQVVKAMSQTAFGSKSTKQPLHVSSRNKTSASIIPSHRYKRYFGIRAPGSF